MTASGAALRLLAGKMEVCFGASEVLWVKSHKAEVLSLTAVTWQSCSLKGTAEGAQR